MSLSLHGLFTNFSSLAVLVGSLTNQFSTWWPPRSSTQGVIQGAPPTDYTIRTQPQLLALFSDAVGPEGITPKSLRDFVGSTITMNPGGTPPSAPLPLPGWTTESRPTGMVGPAMGYNYDTQALDMWDDRAQQWVNPTFGGGTTTVPTHFGGPVMFTGPVLMPNLPVTCTMQHSSTLWNNGQTVSIAP